MFDFGLVRVSLSHPWSVYMCVFFVFLVSLDRVSLDLKRKKAKTALVDFGSLRFYKSILEETAPVDSIGCVQTDVRKGSAAPSLVCLFSQNVSTNAPHKTRISPDASQGRKKKSVDKSALETVFVIVVIFGSRKRFGLVA
ncbi:hypothetical protein NL108_009855 [Boleophthalmus pectinirostris]|nr:hypothetical protein NL108_009855 [Boleophthalmus pectinirostris]